MPWRLATASSSPGPARVGARALVRHAGDHVVPTTLLRPSCVLPSPRTPFRFPGVDTYPLPAGPARAGGHAVVGHAATRFYSSVSF